MSRRDLEPWLDAEARETWKKGLELSRTAALRAIFRMLERLKEELDGERLRGLPNLGLDSNSYRAARVRARRGAHTKKPDELLWKRTLVLTEHGDMVFARWNHTDNAWEVDAPMPADLFPEDAEKLANTIVECVALHLRKQKDSGRRYDSIRRFANSLWEVCEYGKTLPQDSSLSEN